MVNLRTQKRVAAAVLKCGRGRVWIDPNEADQVSQANSSRLILIQETLLES
jgi:large subunit ribosomal protein L19e